ncbi:MAG: tetratricopeptide repeat protein [Saprospiraceae bacterium]
MNKYFQIFILLNILCTGFLNAQNADSLLSIARKERYSNPEMALEVAEKVYAISKENKWFNSLGESSKIIGILYRNNGDFKNASDFFEKALNAYSKIPDSVGIADVLNNYGVLEKMRGDFEKALFYLFKAAKIYESKNINPKLANTNLNIANTFQKDNDLINAIKFHHLSHSLFLKHGDSIKIADAKYSLAADYLLNNQLDSSLIYAENSIKYYYDLGLWDGEADAQDILAQIAREHNDFPKAENLYQSAIQLYLENAEPNDPRLFMLYLNRGGLFIEMKKGEQALADLRKAKFLLADRNEPDNRLRLARGFTDAYELTGQLDSALLMNKEAFIWLDTLEAKGRADAIAEMKEKYETEKKENEIIQAKLKAEQLSTQRNLFIVLFLAILSLSIFGYYYFQQKQKATRTITQQNQKIHQQEIQELLKTQELTAINSMLEGQENERIRIAKDLHDRLGSILTTVKWSFDAYLEKQAPKQGTDPLIKAGSMLDDAYQEVRRIAHDMISGVLTKFGLVPALEELARTISTSGKMQIKVMSSGLGDRLENKVEITLYRVIQELLSNILKHANATEAIIQLTRLNGELNISVEDNGKGFDTEKIKYGMGIKNIEARVQALDGSFFIDSGKGNGTTVMIDLPV